MKCIDRLTEYKDVDFDQIIIHIKKGKIKSGRYAHLVKIDNKMKIKTDGKELFIDGKDSDEPR